MGQRAKWRLATVIGAAGLALTSGLGALIVSSGTAGSAPANAPVTQFSLPPGITAQPIPQNTRATDSTSTSTISPNTGAGAGWTFQVTDNWKAGDKIAINVVPSNQIGSAIPAGSGPQSCNTPYPQGANQTITDGSNYVGFPDFAAGGKSIKKKVVSAVWPELSSQAGGTKPPLFTESETGLITKCGGSTIPEKTYSTLVFTFANSGSQTSSTYNVGVGFSIGTVVDNTPQIDSGPVSYNVGFGASTGPIFPTATYTSGTVTSAITIPPNATVTGETPAGNSPPSGLQRDTQTQTVSGSIPDFTVIEQTSNNKGAALPPLENGAPSPADTSMTVGIQTPGDICLVIDNHDGSALTWAQGISANSWSVSPGSNQSGFTARAGPASVLQKGMVMPFDTLQLPVVSQSNIDAAWTATGLSITGTASADGPVFAYVYWTQDPGCNHDAKGHPTFALEGTEGSSDSILGYVQLTTVSEMAPSVFGSIQDATAAQALEHQFNYSLGQCVTNQYPLFAQGPSVLLATNATWYDGLGAAYAAGQINSGVLFTGSDGSVDPQALQAIRLEGVQTVYIVGGPLAISQSEVTQLQNTPSYLCGGTIPRLNILGAQENLTVLQPFQGQTFLDTNALLASFVGASPQTLLPTNGLSTYGQSPYPFIDPACGNCGQSSTTTGPTTKVNTALIVTDNTFQDGISASVPAYDNHFPLIETDPNGLTPQAITALQDTHIGQAIIVGGALAVSDNVFNQLASGDNGQFAPMSVLRIAGIDGSDTSTQLAAFELASSPGPGGAPGQSLGLAYNNNDVNWNYFTAQTAGSGSGASQFTFNPHVSAHVVLLARGDYFTDAEGGGAELSFNDQGFLCSFSKKKPTAGPPGSSGGCANNFFPLILTEDSNNLGPYASSFLNNAGLSVSLLAGEAPAFGWWGPQTATTNADLNGDQSNNASSNAYTVQPIGGTVALTLSLLGNALTQVTAG